MVELSWNVEQWTHISELDCTSPDKCHFLFAGSIDPLEDLADVAREENLWYHIDAAYGGFFMLCPQLKNRFKGIQESDSLVVDPHKGLNLPTGTGAVIFKRRHLSNEVYGSYMQEINEDELSPTDISPELSRHFRGVRMWLPLQVLGVAPFRSMLLEKQLLAQYFMKGIKKSPHFQVGPEPDLSIVLFRFNPIGCQDDLKLLNQQIVEEVQAEGRVFFSSTTIQDTFWLRLAILNFRTHLEHLDEAIHVINRIANQVWQRWRKIK